MISAAEAVRSKLRAVPEAQTSQKAVRAYGDDICWWVAKVVKFETTMAVWGLYEEDFWSSLWGTVWGDPPHPALQDFLREAEDLRPIMVPAAHSKLYRSLDTYPNPIALIHEEVRPTAMHLLGRFGVTALTVAVYGAAKLRFSLDDGSK